jgi:hypothetical protein
MEIKGFTLDFTPLTVHCNIVVDNTVSDEQVYNSYSSQYVPDYTVVPLTLRPNVTVLDKDGVLASGVVNSALANITWTEVIGTTETVITASNDGYEILSADNDNGCIRVKKNLTPDTTATLRFAAQYTDTRTGQVFQLKASYLLSCNSSSKSIPVLTLDTDHSTLYNPLRDTATKKVTAQLYVNGGICPASYRQFVWDISHDGKTWENVGDSLMHYFVTVSSDGTYCTVDQSLMGSKFLLRCRAKYSEDGKPSAVTLDDNSPCKTATFTRWIPKLQTEIVAAKSVKAGNTQMQVDLIVSDTKNALSNYQDVYLPVWYGNAQTSAGTVTPTTVLGYGAPLTIPTSFISATYGGILGADLVDRGPLTALTDDSGALVTDEAGAIIVIN